MTTAVIIHLAVDGSFRASLDQSIAVSLVFDGENEPEKQNIGKQLYPPSITKILMFYYCYYYYYYLLLLLILCYITS